MRKIVTSLVAAVALAIPAVATARDTPDQQLSKLLAGRVAGKPTDCIPLNWATSSQIIEGQALVYQFGGTVWVNRPRSGAESLRDDDVLVTKTIGTQLCRIDTVNLIDRATRFQRGFVVLGDFVPYKRVK